jgi:hypothetical protein
LAWLEEKSYQSKSINNMQHGYEEKNYDQAKEGVVDPASASYGYAEDNGPAGEGIEPNEAETKRELKPRFVQDWSMFLKG